MNAKRKHEPTEPTLTDLHRKALRVMQEHNYRDYTDLELACILEVQGPSKPASDLYAMGYVQLGASLRRCSITHKYQTTYQAKAST
jgi:hypothetical protein